LPFLYISVITILLQAIALSLLAMPLMAFHFDKSLKVMDDEKETLFIRSADKHGIVCARTQLKLVL
jgi:hypothetical protein